MTGLAQKSNNFFGVASTNCQTGGKMYSYRWAILRIKYFLSFSCNKCVFSIKKFRFHIYISGMFPRLKISMSMKIHLIIFQYFLPSLFLNNYLKLSYNLYEVILSFLVVKFCYGFLLPVYLQFRIKFTS